MDFDRLDEILKERRMSRRKLALSTGINEHTMSTAFKRKSGLSVYEILCISKFLGINIDELVKTNKRKEDDCLLPKVIHNYQKNPFKNDPFITVHQAFVNLYHGREYECQWHEDLRGENGDKVLGLTSFTEGKVPQVFVSTAISVSDSVEVYAHELAHVAVGIDHQHDDEWETAFEAIYQEYNRLIESEDDALREMPTLQELCNEHSLWAQKISQVADTIDNVIDTLIEFGNGGKISDISNADKELMDIRDFLYSMVDNANCITHRDVVSVIRCKDCEYAGKFDDYNYAICRNTGMGVNAMDFCSDAQMQSGGDGDAAE